MTLVRIALDVPGPTGLARAAGRIRATPTRRRTVADTIVLPEPFVTALADGVAVVELAATGTDWCWRIDELTPVLATRYVAVPESPDTIGYEDLVDVDPTTLDPAAEPEAAWTVALAAVAAASLQPVDVVTGTEPRPAGALMVLWRDYRADQSVRPVNMIDGDWWELVPTPDTTDPTPPTDLTPSAITDSSFTVTWEAGTDDVAVTGYDVRLDGGAPVRVPPVPRARAFADLDPSTEYTVEIRSVDAADNVSAYVPLEVTTLAETGETFSIYEGAPTGVWEMSTGGTPTIITARGFYKFNSADPVGGLPTGQVLGGKAWVPADTPPEELPTQATFTLYGPNVGLDSAPVQTKVVSTAGVVAGSLVSGLFDAAQDMGADGDIWVIGVQFTGPADAGKYVFGTGTRPNADAVVSSSGKNLAWAEQTGPLQALSSQFRIGGGAAGTPGEQTQSYAVDGIFGSGA